MPSRDDSHETDSSDDVSQADHALAASVAWEAGELLVRLRGHLVAEGVDTDTLKAEGDRQAHDLIMELLAGRLAAGDAVLSEEGGDNAVRLDADRAGHGAVFP